MLEKCKRRKQRKIKIKCEREITTSNVTQNIRTYQIKKKNVKE